MNIMYLTANVLGDSGANAAEIFPKEAQLSSMIDNVYVADFNKNKKYITEVQHVKFLKIRYKKFSFLNILKNSIRITILCKRHDITLIHCFYRSKNMHLISLIKLFLLLTNVKTKILLDHRSVNLAKGAMKIQKLLINQIFSPFIDYFSGNTFAVETNYIFCPKNKYIIDLGYDKLPKPIRVLSNQNNHINVWYIGNLIAKNRNAEFILNIFDLLSKHVSVNKTFTIHIAGPLSNYNKVKIYNKNSINYHGVVERSELYKLLQRFPGIGIAFMDYKNHNFAPALKLIEYSIFGFKIIASDTQGLRLQQQRARLPNITFVNHDLSSWVNAILKEIYEPAKYDTWIDSNKWSYSMIFKKQVLPIYKKIESSIS